MMKVEKQFLKISEAAEVLDVHYNTILRQIKKGSIPAVKIGRTWYIPATFFQEMQKQAKKEVV